MKVKDFFNSDYLMVANFQVPCHVGITEEERATPQTIMLSLRLYFPSVQAGRSDDLRHTVDYAEITEQIRSLLLIRKFNLIEAVAEAIAKKILEHKLVHAVLVEATKKGLPDIDSVGASIFRSKES